MTEPAATDPPVPARHERHVLENVNHIIDRKVLDGSGPLPLSPLIYEVCGEKYPAKRVRSCKTCNITPIELRAAVEEQILSGYSKAAIARQLPEEMGITADNLGDHARAGHMPLDLETRNAIMEVAHQQAGDPASATLATDVGMANIVIQKVFAKLQRGDYDETLDLDDGFAAMRFIRDLQRMGAEEGVTNEVMVERYRMIWEAIEEVGGPEVAKAVHQFMSTDPILRKIKNQAFPLMTDDTITAESEEGDTDEPGEG